MAVCRELYKFNLTFFLVLCIANGEIYVRSVDVSRQVYTFNVYGISGGAAKEQMPSC